jgi:hypothetical protein
LKKYKRVDIFVCNNGFGHIKRELGIIFNLNSKIDFLKFVIHVKHDHYKKFVCLIDEWYPNINMDNVKFEFESMKNMPDYSFNSSYKSFEYSLWLDELRLLNLKSDLIISDNLIGILDVYPKSILIGSFLWTEISRLHDINDFSVVVDFERKVLKRNSPKMFGLDMFATEEVKKDTEFIGLPWFCEKYLNHQNQHNFKNKITLLVSGGGTGNTKESLYKIINFLNDFEYFEIFIDQTLKNSMSNLNNFNVFDYSNERFQQVDWIIGRPGIGLLSDVVKFRIPIIMVSDEKNEEIQSNIKQAVFCGLGIDFNGIGVNIEDRIQQLVDLLQNKKIHKEILDSLIKQKCGGTDILTEMLINDYIL